MNSNKKLFKLPKYVGKDRVNWQEVLLRTAYAAGMISIALMAPNAVRVLKNFKISDNRSYIFRAKRSMEKLIKLGLLKRSVRAGEIYVEITEKGDSYLRNIYKIPIKKVWDSKWRLVIYDVPEKNRGSRNQFRRKLQEIGFRLLQTSVWIYPYKAEGLIDLIKTDSKLAEEVVYLETSYIENEAKMKRMFGL